MSFFARRRDRVPARPEILPGLDFLPSILKGVCSLAAWNVRFLTVVEAVGLRDSYNPPDCLEFWLKKKVRQEIIATTSWDVLVM